MLCASVFFIAGACWAGMGARGREYDRMMREHFEGRDKDGE
jgi:hypothetical protein